MMFLEDLFFVWFLVLLLAGKDMGLKVQDPRILELCFCFCHITSLLLTSLCVCMFKSVRYILRLPATVDYNNSVVL